MKEFLSAKYYPNGERDEKEGEAVMYDFKKLRERYLNCPEFYQLVSAMESYIVQAGFNPHELREAVFFATVKYAQEHVQPIMIGGVVYEPKDQP